MPEGLPVERHGRYQIKITEPMEENAYLDSATLHIFDLPPGWDLVTDERMSTGAPEVTGRTIFFREIRSATLARNDRGEDVTSAVTSADRVAAPPGELDKRFIGRLRQPHSLTVEFGGVINPPVLQGLDPATTALAVLAIDGLLAAFCLGLYTAREQMRMERQK